MPRPIYDRLSKTSKKKLDALEYEHNQHFVTFSNAKDSKVNEIQAIENRLNKLMLKARKELEKSVPHALGTAMEMRYVKADLLILKSILTVLRSNQFYHRLMMMLIQDTKAGVEYDPKRIADLVPLEFSDLIEQSIISSNMENTLGDLKAELDGHLGGDGQ